MSKIITDAVLSETLELIRSRMMRVARIAGVRGEAAEDAASEGYGAALGRFRHRHGLGEPTTVGLLLRVAERATLREVRRLLREDSRFISLSDQRRLADLGIGGD